MSYSIPKKKNPWEVGQDFLQKLKTPKLINPWEGGGGGGVWYNGDLVIFYQK